MLVTATVPWRIPELGGIITAFVQISMACTKEEDTHKESFGCHLEVLGTP